MLATEPVVKAEASKVTVAVATVVIFGTLAIFLYPAMYPLVGALVSPEKTYGIYIGSTMHEVAQVVAAGHAISPDAENAAVIAKMLRVMMLAPFLIILAQLAAAPAQAAAQEKQKRSPFRGLRCCLSWWPGCLTPSTCCRKPCGYAGLITLETAAAGDGDGGAGGDHPHQRAEKSRCETAADGAAAVHLADCRRRRD